MRTLIGIVVIAAIVYALGSFGVLPLGPALSGFHWPPFDLERVLPPELTALLPSEKKTDATPEQQQQAETTLDAQLAEAYVYSQLGESDKEKYRIMLDAFETREEREYPYTGVDDMGQIRNLVIADHPEFFDISSVHAETVTTKGLFSSSETTTIRGVYDYDEETSAAMRQRLEASAAACLAAMPQGLDDYGKAKYLYTYIAANVTYDWDAARALGEGSEQHVGQTAYNALVEGRAVCGGYASAFQYLAQRLGLQCEYVTGVSAGQLHAWNIVRLDGDYYHVDPTRADPQFVDEGGANVEGSDPSFDYLCLPTSDILLTHVIDKGVPVPYCASMADNYFVRENAYLTMPDVAHVGALIQDGIENGMQSIQFRCASKDVYDQMLYELFDAGRVYEYLSASSCRYMLNNDLFTVKILL